MKDQCEARHTCAHQIYKFRSEEVQIRGQLGMSFGNHRAVQNTAVFVRSEVVLCRVVLGWGSTPHALLRNRKGSYPLHLARSVDAGYDCRAMSVDGSFRTSAKTVFRLRQRSAAIARFGDMRRINNRPFQ